MPAILFLFGAGLFFSLLDQWKVNLPEMRLVGGVIIVLASSLPLLLGFVLPKPYPVSDPPYHPARIQYLKSIPKSSRAAQNSSLDKNMITSSYKFKIHNLSKIAKKRNQTLSQMAIAWVLRHSTMTSALIGARTINQLNECIDSLKNLKFSNSEIKQIDKFAKEEKINLWETSSKY